MGLLLSPMLLSMALPTCVGVSSGSEQPRQSGGTAGTGSPPSSTSWPSQCPGQRLSTTPGSRRAVGNRDICTGKKTQGWSVGKGVPPTGAVTGGGQEPGLSSSALHCYFHALREFLRTCKTHLSVTALLAFNNKNF